LASRSLRHPPPAAISRGLRRLFALKRAPIRSSSVRDARFLSVRIGAANVTFSAH